MVYGFNGNAYGVGVGGSTNNTLNMQNEIALGGSINIKSQKSINHLGGSANKDNLINIKKEKERIHQLLNAS